ncbi:hypothetical protein RhiirA4_490745 [Rhizophagus irregularis]|uniref:Uncharacterized protein n=1 Tax=Rhizophagus irregularis TaxID=588596 RepID=A0A2I1HVW1_9GLOM|nr:hypothetical protein RhiirA4_490745 [Rhizophagus irregularis]
MKQFVFITKKRIGRRIYNKFKEAEKFKESKKGKGNDAQSTHQKGGTNKTRRRSLGLTQPNLKEKRVSLFQRCEKFEEEADLAITALTASRRYVLGTEEVLCLEIINQRKL